ncbi:mitochondrial intermembrane space import and assembly protein 40-B-like [Watersipora subatra]|uniref:mitochondrial intermembrane space import and assembly protein 40-B-like n=1 Tax=Watersipora subatra TaxID=2589382 RepID=UPI00355B6055
MSHCEQEGKDKVIFMTEDDYRQPIDSKLAQVEPEEEEGLIKENGEINWGCPCLGGMATGPCGQEFREAFSCFHYSKEEMKGSECVELFQKMSECMSQYPDLYPENNDEEKTIESSDSKGTDSKS